MPTATAALPSDHLTSPKAPGSRQATPNDSFSLSGGRSAQTKEFLTKTLREDPNNAQAWFLLGNLLLKEDQGAMGVTECIPGSDFEVPSSSPTHCFVRCVELDPRGTSLSSPEAGWVALGTELLGKGAATVHGEEITATECFMKAVVQSPSSPVAWNLLASSMLTLQEYVVETSHDGPASVFGVKQCLLQSLAINPQWGRSWRLLGQALLPGEEIVIPPFFTPDFEEMGRAKHEGKKHLCGKLRCYQYATKFSPRDPLAWVLLARSSIGIDSEANVLKYLTRGLELDRTSPLLWAFAASILLKLLSLPVAEETTQTPDDWKSSFLVSDDLPERVPCVRVGGRLYNYFDCATECWAWTGEHHQQSNAFGGVDPLMYTPAVRPEPSTGGLVSEVLCSTSLHFDLAPKNAIVAVFRQIGQHVMLGKLSPFEVDPKLAKRMREGSDTALVVAPQDLSWDSAADLVSVHAVPKTKGVQCIRNLLSLSNKVKSILGVQAPLAWGRDETEFSLIYPYYLEGSLQTLLDGFLAPRWADPDLEALETLPPLCEPGPFSVLDESQMQHAVAGGLLGWPRLVALGYRLVSMLNAVREVLHLSPNNWGLGTGQFVWRAGKKNGYELGPQHGLQQPQQTLSLEDVFLPFGEATVLFHKAIQCASHPSLVQNVVGLLRQAWLYPYSSDSIDGFAAALRTKLETGSPFTSRTVGLQFLTLLQTADRPHQTSNPLRVLARGLEELQQRMHLSPLEFLESVAIPKEGMELSLPEAEHVADAVRVQGGLAIESSSTPGILEPVPANDPVPNPTIVIHGEEDQGQLVQGRKAVSVAWSEHSPLREGGEEAEKFTEVAN
jgi:hypothetical protein